ncbi:MAG TPA: SDR family oxidoreductase [Gemmatimonadetes bacterium]|jgi:pteridine reductase|nr:SDR family oxidoreductase [Gemmatimonadota bacterium]
MSRVALITGGAVRVGRAISIALAKAGYDLAISYNSSEEPAKNLQNNLRIEGREVLLLGGDLSCPVTIDKMGSTFRDNFQRLDLLVNNAANFYSTSLLDTTCDEWDKVMAVNLRAPHLLVKEFANMLTESCGSVINIADHLGLSPRTSYAHHSVAKAGLIHLTRIQAMTLAPDVRVNAIAPGLVLPPEDMDREKYDAEVANTLLKRTGTLEDVTQAIMFLVNAPNITGQTLVVDGGSTLS